MAGASGPWRAAVVMARLVPVVRSRTAPATRHADPAGSLPAVERGAAMNDRRVPRNPATSALAAATTERLLAAETRIAATWTLVRGAQKRIERGQRPRPLRVDGWVPRDA